MIFSVQLADTGVLGATSVLRRPPDPAEIPGLTYAQTAITAPFGTSLLPRPRLGRVAMIAAWEDDNAFEGFIADHPLAERFAEGWQVRLRPLRVYGSWAGLPDLPSDPLPIADSEPVAVLTLGRLRLNRGLAFLRTSARAEGAALGHPALLAATAIARPPHLVCTFSLWRSAGEMRDYATGTTGAHHAAFKADRARPFHSESAFIRFRPYHSQGSWDGRDPLGELLTS